MKARKSYLLKKAVVVQPEVLTRLVDSLGIPADQTRYKVHCRHGVTLEPTTLEEVLSLNNIPTRAIEKLSINSGGEFEPKLFVEFRDDESGAVLYSVEGTDDEVTRYSDIIDEHLDRMIQGYSFLVIEPERFLTPILASAFVCLLGIEVIITLIFHSHPVRQVLITVTTILLSVLFVGTTVIGMLVLNGYLIRRAFPRVSFCIGDGKERHESLVDQRKRYGLGAILFGLALGLAVALIAVHF